VRSSSNPEDLDRPTRLSRFRGWLKNAWVPVALVFTALLMCLTVTLNHSHQLSPLDEWVYFDYVTKIPSQGVVHQGERIGEPALEVMACYGDPFGARGEPCTGPNGHYSKYAQYPLAGKTSADIYSPLYFDVAWAVGATIHAVTGLDLLVGARLSGFLWLAGGLIVFYAACRELRLRKMTAFGLGLITIGSISALYAYTYITTDAPSFMVGASILLLGVRYLRGKGSGWWLLPVTVVAVLLKVTNIFAIGLLALMMVIYAAMKWKQTYNSTRSRPSPPRVIALAAIMSIVAVATEVGWLLVRAALRVGPGGDQAIDSPLSIRGVASQLTAFVGIPSARLADGALSLPYAILSIAGVFGLLLVTRGAGLKRAFSIAVPSAIVFFPPLLLVAMSIALGSAFPISTRYGAPLMPAILIAIGMLTRNRAMTALTVAYGAVLVIAIIGRSFYLP